MVVVAAALCRVVLPPETLELAALRVRGISLQRVRPVPAEFTFKEGAFLSPEETAAAQSLAAPAPVRLARGRLSQDRRRWALEAAAAGQCPTPLERTWLVAPAKLALPSL